MSVGAQDPVYRALQPCDRVRLQELHDQLFPISYEADFFNKATLGIDSIASIAAFVQGELVAFITYRTVPYHSCEDQGLLGVDLCVAGAERSVAYILTLGTDEAHRRRGLASALLARTLSECQARWLCLPGLHQLTPHAQADHRCLLLYLHVITYNDAALAFYARHGFQMLRRENQFYVIRQEHYDAFALGVYLNGGSAPSTASTAVSALHAAAAAALRWFVNNCTAARRPVCALPARGNDKSDA